MKKYPEFTVSADACIFGALGLMILPLNWILAAFLAAAFHEFCHFLTLRLWNVQVYGFQIGLGGAEIETEPMTSLQELACSLAGPAGSFLLVAFLRYFPELAICAGIQGLFNLLPLYPLDGGRALRSALNLICPARQDRIMFLFRGTVIFAVLLLGLWGFFRLRLGIGILILTFLVIHRGLGRKIPCKQTQKRVQ